MTQAHKTPGALVQFKPSIFKTTIGQIYFGQYEGRVYEIIQEKYPGHMVIKDIQTGKLVCNARGEPFAFHDNDFQTIPPALRRTLRP